MEIGYGFIKTFVKNNLPLEHQKTKLMKKTCILTVLLLFGLIAQGQETEKPNRAIISKTATLSTGVSIPVDDFAETATDIGPAGNAKPGFYLAGSVDLFRKFAGWKFEANTTFNPIETNKLVIIENYPDTETGTWTNVKLLTGPQIKFGSDKLNATIGAMFGGMWLYYPAFTVEIDGQETIMKMQNISTRNFAQQYHAGLSYAITKNIALGFTIKYEHANAEAQYLKITEKYQLGNAFNLEYEQGTQSRINNSPPSGEAYTGWIGYGRSEHTINQKVTELKAGLSVQIIL